MAASAQPGVGSCVHVFLPHECSHYILVKTSVCSPVWRQDWQAGVLYAVIVIKKDGDLGSIMAVTAGPSSVHV